MTESRSSRPPVRFEDGLYSQSSGDVYLDFDTNVYRHVNGERVLAPTGDETEALEPATATLSRRAIAAPREACNGTYTHCETNQCQSAVFYRNYNPTTDHFSDEYGYHLAHGEQGDIRDEPYRRYGPRGVRAMHSGLWGFYSRTCFP